ncbi:hypothetical protein FQN54_001210 [Arachnomyces sp. PD_36]|nr:hypothetical protein FQN54_001210 [Arachnomyces sp. PD_36]
MTWDIQTATEEQLVNLCEQAGDERIGGDIGGNWVIKLSDEIAVKFGYGVTPAEAATQEFAYRHVDPSIVRVPRVYRYFQVPTKLSRPKGYLFMDYIPGPTLKDLDLEENQDIIPRVANIIAHLGQIPGGQSPGPVGNGYQQGYLWGDDGAETIFHSVQDLNASLNKRLVIRKLSIDLTPYPLVLCHMDLCRRNMILRETGDIWLVDWGHAGLLPRFFEIATITCLNPYDKPYQKPLLEAAEQAVGLTEEERGLVKLLHIARAMSLRYLL